MPGPSLFARPFPFGEEGDFPPDGAFSALWDQLAPSARDDIWLGRQVPRYTSYPPATSFQDQVTPAAYRAALAALPPEVPVSLYLHVPFCQKLCLYCGCHTMPTRQHGRVSAYLDSVHKELDTLARIAPTPRRVAGIHFGGGSPNMMSEKDMGLMMGALARQFDLSACGEIAMELDPRLVTKAQARTLGLLGVTRVSLGVQDFDPRVQEAIGREQPFDLVAHACEALRAAGLGSINFDLMYGLPMQSPASIEDSARMAAALEPDRIALFSYAHVPQVKAHQKALEDYILPGPHLTLSLETAARGALVAAGYAEIGMDHFALPGDSLARAAETGRLRRTFQGYTDDNAAHQLGIGASAIGRVGGTFFQNTRDVAAYQDDIRAAGLATRRGLSLSGEDRFRADLIERLMCDLRVDIEAVCRAHHFAPAAMTAEMEALAPFEEAGIIRRNGYKIALATRHRMAVRVIASLFDKTRRQADAPVSRAV